MKLTLWGILLPFIGIFIGFISKQVIHFKRLRQLKLIDYLPPFFLIGSQLISEGQQQLSILEFIVLALLVLAVSLALFLAIRDRELILPRYFRIFWRLTFLISIIWYLVFLILMLF
ncbi:DUF3397 family protein [Agrilactobacillus fermenti]|uniref:DUF3397 family protein n=1 Tax=Agrilactobacillus fermenti TaxID=2586909 RepID=UPI001E5C6E38|nr:DUF3397 family protein [Agrilactobacillus fermenti]MCD2255319.1 DUF3397 family protein [Agrilactobacillus fermenti]